MRIKEAEKKDTSLRLVGCRKEDVRIPSTSGPTNSFFSNGVRMEEGGLNSQVTLLPLSIGYANQECIM